MKYLKKFKSNNYNIGDFVIVYDVIGEIINIIDNKYPGGIKIRTYLIYIFDNDSSISVRKNEIKRLATEEEMKEYTIKKDADKYNL